MRLERALLITFVFSLGAAGLWAQGRTIGPDWPAARADAQLTSWQRNDPNISVANLSKPGFELQWKERVETAPRGGRALGQAITINGVNLFMPVSLVVGGANRIFAIDNDTGFVLWRRQFEDVAGTTTAACPGGMTGAAARSVNAALPVPAVVPGGGGRGGRGYQSMTGQPGEGAPTDLPQRGGGAGRGAPGAGGRGAGAAGAGTAGAPANPAAGRAGAPPARGGGGGGLGRLGGPAYLVSAGGNLHAIGWVNGADIQKPVPVLPANARYSDAMAVNDSLYLTTSENCGGAANGVWAVDLGSEARSVRSWKTNGGSPVGPVAFTPDGTPLVAIGASASSAGSSAEARYANAIVALDPKTLQPRDWFTHRTADFVTAPAIFRHGSRDIVAAATRDGRILLLDARSLGGANHSTPLHSFQLVPGGRGTAAPQALAVWQETPATPAPPPAAGGAAPATPPALPTPQGGTTWILAPVAGQLRAVRLVDRGGRVSLQPGWTSRDLVNPLAPIVVNDVVFTASAGSASSTPAVLYAIDGRTGKEVWNSGKTIESFTTGPGFWSSNSQVYVATDDGTVYAFGYTLERR
jgi:outer membrane protein assembly factor BamB